MPSLGEYELREIENTEDVSQSSEDTSILVDILSALVFIAAMAVALFVVAKVMLPHGILYYLTVDPAEEKKEMEGSQYDGEVQDDGTILVPDLAGRTAEEAEAVAKSLGLGIKKIGEVPSNEPVGVIVEQALSPGTAVEAHTTITYNSSAGPQRSTLPEVAGMYLYQAAEEMEKAGFTDISVTKEPSQTVKCGIVMGCSPAGGSSASTGDVISLKVSSGAAGAMSFVDTYSGMAFEDAAKAASSAGLIVYRDKGYSSLQEKGAVVCQYPEGGASVPYGADLSLSVCLGDVPEPAGTYRVRIVQPDNAVAGSYMLTYTEVWKGAVYEGIVLRGDSMDFGLEIDVPDYSGRGAGTLHYYEKDEDGQYVSRCSWDVSRQEGSDTAYVNMVAGKEDSNV